MVLKKKLKKKKSSGVKLGKTSIKSAKAKKKANEERKAGKSEASYVKFPQGKKILWIIPPTSDAMNGYPTVDKFTHNNLGPEEKGWGQCVRTDMSKETRDQCEGCKYVNTLWDKARKMKSEGKFKLEEKYKKLAAKQGVKTKALCQVLDVTGVYNKAGEAVRKFPSCFGKNYKAEEQAYDKCETCPFQNSCKEGVQKWEMQFGASEKLTEKLGEDEVDVTDPAAAIPLKIVRKGEGAIHTRYTDEWMKPIEIPPHVISFVEKHAVDLTKALKPSTPEQMHAMLTGGDGYSTTIVSKEDFSSKKKLKKGKSSKMVEKPTVTKEQREKLRERLKADSKKKLKKKV